MIAKRVKFVIAENGIGRVAADHRTSDLQHFTDCGTAIDKIADENRLATLRNIDAVSFLVTELCEQCS